MNQRRIDCEAALKQILAYIDHELGDEERAAMQGHLHTCKSCFSRMEFERLLKRKVGALRDDKASPQLSDRVKTLLKNY
jgi:anti-sigma factor (TIGR02949 family)